MALFCSALWPDFAPPFTQTSSFNINASFNAGGPDEGFANFKLTVTSPTMTDQTATTNVTANANQNITVVGRSWINTAAIYSRWGDFPPNFQYLDIGALPVPLIATGTHNPYAYAGFLAGLLTIPDVGGTPAKNAKYRLWSKVLLKGCCADGKIKRLVVSSKDKDGGYELLFMPGSADFGAVNLQRINDSKFTFKYEFHGAPYPAAEVGIQSVRSRTSTTIWHFISGEITCGPDNKFVVNLSLYGSDFPTHEAFINNIEFGRKDQGAITNLWIPLPSDPEYVNGVMP